MTSDQPGRREAPGGLAHSEAPLGPFVLAALTATLTAGTALGAYNLVHLQWLFGVPISVESRRLHADFQLSGLMTLFISGVAMTVLPRFWDAAPPRRFVSRLVLALVGSGLALHVLGVLGQTSLIVPAAAFSLGAGLIFSSWLIHARWTGAREPWRHDWLLVAGTLWWPLGKLLWMLGSIDVDDEALLGRGVDAGEDALLLGFVLSWIVGMAPRVLPFFARIGHPRSPGLAAIGITLTLGVGLRSAGLILDRSGVGVLAAGDVVTAVALLLFCTGLDVFATGQLPILGTTGAFRRSILAACFWLALGALSLMVFGVGKVVWGFSPHSLWRDGARHSIAAGFALGLLMGTSSRLVPTFLGGALLWPRAVHLGFILFHLAVLARWLQAVGTVWWPPALALSAWSGLGAFLGMLPWATSLAVLIRRRRHTFATFAGA